MKKSLLLFLSLVVISFGFAQKTDKPLTAYAITGVQKGGSNWTEVRLINLTTGEELQTIYASAAEAELLNARTGKPVIKRDAVANAASTTQGQEPIAQLFKQEGINKTALLSRKITAAPRQPYDQPFATTSAACAYDKKFNRLYYTPMGIAQLRYIDLKAKSPKVYYFEDEAFGVVKGRGDVGSQITRMVIAADGNGYALSNDANHLIRFTVKKKPEITDLGALTDDPTNGNRSVHGSANFGGDMIADKEGNLYLIGANHSVFKIGIGNKVASFVGLIKGLPRGFSTNGAAAQGDSKVIVSSSGSTDGYYRFDLNTLQSEKVSEGNTVFNASDLANASFAFEKKEEKPKENVSPIAVESRLPKLNLSNEAITGNGISVYPNPVTEGYFKLSFANQQPGRYQIQLLDDAGKIVSMRQVTLGGKSQVEEFRLPQKPAAGSYLVRVTGENGAYTETKKIIVQ